MNTRIETSITSRRRCRKVCNSVIPTGNFRINDTRRRTWALLSQKRLNPRNKSRGASESFVLRGNPGQIRSPRHGTTIFRNASTEWYSPLYLPINFSNDINAARQAERERDQIMREISIYSAGKSRETENSWRHKYRFFFRNRIARERKYGKNYTMLSCALCLLSRVNR